MAKKLRVHEIASEFGVDSKVALEMLRNLGWVVSSPSKSVEPTAARHLRAALQEFAPRTQSEPLFPSLDGPGGTDAVALLGALPKRMPELIDLLLRNDRGASDAHELVNRACDGRRFYYVPLRAQESLRVASDLVTSVNDSDLLSDRGVAVLVRPGGSRPHATLLAWVVGVDKLEIVSAALALSGTGGQPRLMVGKVAQAVILRDLGSFPTGGRKYCQELAALSAIIPEPAGQSWRQSEGEVGTKPSRGEPKRLPDEETRIIYARRSLFGVSTGGQRPQQERWQVRGHWRNQWHPSSKLHRRIWIDDHTAGAVNGEEVRRDRVYVIAPGESRSRDTRGNPGPVVPGSGWAGELGRLPG